MAPRIRELSTVVWWPSASFSEPSATAAIIGPISVPRPPTITQISTSAVVPRLNTLGVTISAQLANRQPASPAIAPEAEKLHAHLVFAHADQRASERAGEDPSGEQISKKQADDHHVVIRDTVDFHV